jgi:hypothetical protein
MRITTISCFPMRGREGEGGRGVYIRTLQGKGNAILFRFPFQFHFPIFIYLFVTHPYRRLSPEFKVKGFQGFIYVCIHT